IYASPLFQAGPDSTHGYDVCAFDRLNANVGGEKDFRAFTDSLHETGMGLLLDIVPNHMRTDCSNRWFADVLERGPRSRYASWFDIDWTSRRPELRGKVLLPILEDHYAKVLEDGKLRLDHRGGKFVLVYHDRAFPLNDAT